MPVVFIEKPYLSMKFCKTPNRAKKVVVIIAKMCYTNDCKLSAEFEVFDI